MGLICEPGISKDHSTLQMLQDSLKYREKNKGKQRKRVEKLTNSATAK